MKPEVVDVPGMAIAVSGFRLDPQAELPDTREDRLIVQVGNARLRFCVHGVGSFV
jgi:hypothetical protein